MKKIFILLSVLILFLNSCSLFQLKNNNIPIQSQSQFESSIVYGDKMEAETGVLYVEKALFFKDKLMGGFYSYPSKSKIFINTKEKKSGSASLEIVLDAKNYSGCAISLSSPVNLKKIKNSGFLEFWVKGSTGGEIAMVGIEDGDRDKKRVYKMLPLSDYVMISSSEWRFVRIPLSDFGDNGKYYDNANQVEIDDKIDWSEILSFKLSINKNENSSFRIFLDDIKIVYADYELATKKSIMEYDILTDKLNPEIKAYPSEQGAEIQFINDKVGKVKLLKPEFYPYIDFEFAESLNLNKLRSSGGAISFYIKGDVKDNLLVRFIDEDIDGPGGTKADDWDFFTEVNLLDYVKDGKISNDKFKQVIIPLSEFIGGGKWTPELGWFEAPVDWYRIKHLQFLISKNDKKSIFELRNIKLQKEGRKVEDVEIFVNQFNYEKDMPKRILIKSMERIDFAMLKIFKDNKMVSGKKLKYIGEYPVWGKGYYYEVYFSEIRNSGKYIAKLQYKSKVFKSYPFYIDAQRDITSIKYNLNFFNVQRCGTAVLPYHKACHLDDAVLPDGKHIDATGGWHDAGDLNKYIYSQWIPVYGFLKVYETSKDNKLKRRVYEEAKWGNDWLLKMVRDDGYMWSAVFNTFDPAKVMTDNKSGNADDRLIKENYWGPVAPYVAECSMSFSEMALASLDKAYKQKNLTAAIKTYKYAEKKIREKFIDDNDFFDLPGTGGFVIASINLFKLTKDKHYKENAKLFLKYILKFQHKTKGYFFVKDNDFTSTWHTFIPFLYVGAIIKYIKEFPDDEYIQDLKNSLKLFLKKFVYKYAYINPYRNMLFLDKDTGEPKNFGVYMDYMGTIIQGENSYYLALAEISMEIGKILNDKKALDVAQNQINFVCGINPFSICQFEGFGNNLKSYHHVLAHFMKDKYFKVKGIIPNGIGSIVGSDDRPFIDLRKKSHPDIKFQTNEPWIPINGWWLMYISRIQEVGE